MKVVVKFAGPLRTAAGVKRAEVELDSETTTGAVLQRVAEQFPGVHLELFGPEPKTYYSIFINDQLVPENDRSVAIVHEGDEVMVLLPVAGGI